MGIFDPPRAESRDAIVQCHRASIKVVMITGDHAKTAAAIGKLLGLNSHKVKTSQDLAEMSEEELRESVVDTEIYARATPADKLRIVKAMQANGMITAMTGDGVNDAPALKQAHAGIAMGINGTSVAQEASKVVLTDDNFATIVKAVEEGRKVYNSLKRSIMYVLPTNMAEALTLLIASFFGSVTPINALQILYINTITSITLSTFIPFQKGEHDVLGQPPRDIRKHLLSSTIIIRTFIVGVIAAMGVVCYFYYFITPDLRRMTVDELKAIGELQTVQQHSAVSVNMIVFTEIFFLFNTVYLKKPSLTLSVFTDIGGLTWIAIAVLLVFQLALTYIPGLNTLFGMAPMKWYQWVFPIALGAFIFLIVEFEKWMRRWHHRGTLISNKYAERRAAARRAAQRNYRRSVRQAAQAEEGDAGNTVEAESSDSSDEETSSDLSDENEEDEETEDAIELEPVDEVDSNPEPETTIPTSSDGSADIVLPPH